MNTIKRHCSQSGWGFQQDPGLELYCSIEGVDRCTLLNTVDNLSSDRSVPHLHLYRSVGNRAGFAAMAMLVIRLFSRS